MAGLDGDRIKLSKAEGRGGWEEATKDTKGEGEGWPNGPDQERSLPE